MQKRNINIPDGTRDMLYLEAETENKVLKSLGCTYEKLGFSEVKTPTLEYYDSFNFPGQPMPQENMFKLTDNNGRLLVLRPDCTTPIARIAAAKLASASLPVKLSYNQRVYRINLGYSGKRSEIMQSGVEIIGADGVRSDLFCITTAIKAMESLGVDFKIEIGHVGFYNAMIAELDLCDEDKAKVRDYVDSKNAVSLGFLGDTAEIGRIMQIPLLFGGKEVFARAESIADGNLAALGALACVKKLYSLLEAAGYGDRVMIDLGLVHKLDYYTGIVFRGFMDGAGEPVLGGGRYNNLLANFGRDLPATGFAINVGLAAETLCKNSDGKGESSADAVVFYATDAFADAEKICTELCSEGINAELSVFETLEDTVVYAKEQGIGRVISIGENGSRKEMTV